MADRVLRDHKEPCVHKNDAYQWKQRLGVEGPLHWDCRQGGCPGGREVTLTEERLGAQRRRRRWVTAEESMVGNSRHKEWQADG